MALGLSAACTTTAPSDAQSGAARPGEAAPAEAAPAEAPPEALPTSAPTPRPGEPFQVDMGQRVVLTSDVEITLSGHSHKISEGDVESPLGISLTIHRGGKDEPWDGWVEPTGDRTFTVAGIELELVDYEYDRWMRLKLK